MTPFHLDIRAIRMGFPESKKSTILEILKIAGAEQKELMEYIKGHYKRDGYEGVKGVCEKDVKGHFTERYIPKLWSELEQKVRDDLKQIKRKKSTIFLIDDFEYYSEKIEKIRRCPQGYYFGPFQKPDLYSGIAEICVKTSELPSKLLQDIDRESSEIWLKYDEVKAQYFGRWSLY